MVLQKIVDLAKEEEMEADMSGGMLKIHKTLAERRVLMTTSKEEYCAEATVDEAKKTVHFSERMKGGNTGPMSGDTEFGSGYGFKIHKEKVVGAKRDESIVQENTLAGENMDYAFKLGDFRKKVEALAQENGYTLKTHIMPLSVGTGNFKTAFLIGTASLLYLFGFLLMVGGSFFAGLALIVLATLVLPRGWKLMEKRLPHALARRKTLAFFLLLTALFLMNGAETDTSSGMLFKNNVVQGTDNPEVVANIAKDLAELVHVYQETQLKTAAAFQVEYGSMTLEEYQTELVEIEAGWQQVDKEAGDLAQYISTLPQDVTAPEKTTLIDELVQAAYAQRPEELIETFGNPSAEGTLSKDSVYQNFEIKNRETVRVLEEEEKATYDKVSVVREQLPSARMIELVQNHFKVTAKEALRIIRKHEKEIGMAWNKEDEFYKRMADGAQVLETGSKTLLMVGGTVVTGGTLAGASMTKVAIAGTSVFVGGVDTALDVQETSITVYGGDQNTLKHIQKTKQDLYPIILLNNVIQVPTDAKAFTEGGFGTLFGIGKDIYDGKIQIDLGKGENSTYAYYDEPVSTTIQTPQGEIETINQYVPDYMKMKNPLLEAKKKNMGIDPATNRYYRVQDDPEYQKAMKEKETTEAAQKAKEKAATTPAKPVIKTPAPVTPKVETPAPSTPKPEPAPAPVVPKIVPNQVVGTCGECDAAGLDCACGRAACRCCAPGDNDCWAFDL